MVERGTGSEHLNSGSDDGRKVVGRKFWTTLLHLYKTRYWDRWTNGLT